ncbi:hypothetical protein [Peribacillus butanolivorans]|uniref:hypothetical protein n=1 Tax=Peribacillus butanolivorans TaxID=421767 RepID=UPI00365E15CA
MHGIQSSMDPGEPVELDVSKMTEQQLKDRGISWAPRNFNQAIDYLSKDTILAETINRSIWEEFIKIKKNEWDKYCKQVSDWELNLFSSRF